jgi:predicted metal-binding membrane protein
VAADVRGASRLEGALKNDRAIVGAGLSLVAAVAWACTLAGAGVFWTHAGGMGAPAHGMAPAAVLLEPWPWSPGYAALVFLMWWVMMVAMMVPSAAPTILLFAAIDRRRRGHGGPGVPAGVFAAGYLAAWGAFSLLATLAQWGLQRGGLLPPGMAAGAGAAVGGVLLLAAGAYQFLPVKQACLRHCRSPVRFLTRRWRPGPSGAFRMGAEHGAFCLGCCWLLMALLFVGGTMNAFWIGGIALHVLLEKLAPQRRQLSHAAGGLLILGGLALILGMA